MFVIQMLETGPEVPLREQLASGRTDPQASLTIDEWGMSGTIHAVE